MPTAVSTLAIKPASGVSTNRQINVTIVTDRTEDEKNSPRKIAADRVARFRAKASSKVITVSAGTISNANRNVVPIA